MEKGESSGELVVRERNAKDVLGQVETQPGPFSFKFSYLDTKILNYVEA